MREARDVARDSLRIVTEQRDGLTRAWGAVLARVTKERDEPADEARRLRNQLGFADRRISTVTKARDGAEKQLAHMERERDEALTEADRLFGVADSALKKRAAAEADLEQLRRDYAALVDATAKPLADEASSTQQEEEHLDE